VQSAAQDEMPIEQRARLAENVQCFFARHPRTLSRNPEIEQEEAEEAEGGLGGLNTNN
jgi:hypothetical protein